MTLQTSPENPAPLHRINAAIAGWVAKLGAVWVEGQVTGISARRGMSQVFISLRDVDQNLSAQVVTSPGTLAPLEPALAEGDRIVLLVKPEFWTNRGSLVLRASDIRAVGLGDLLARVERLKQALAAEGLFAADRKRPLPFLPRRVGLICGRDSAAEHDVINNARRRWPGIDFEIRQVAVQGPTAAAVVTEALLELDGITEVDVIVITRGGGSAEDLLPFSDEVLIRAVSDCLTPIVSAIGHEQDAPLLDHVADVRASTPTDAARRVVPDLGEQQQFVTACRQRALRAVTARLDAARHQLHRLASHPGLADPSSIIEREHALVSADRNRGARALAHQLQLASTTVEHSRAQLRAFSPAATLERGYAIVLDAAGHALRSAETVSAGDPLSIRVADGTVAAVVTDGQVLP